MKNLSTGTNESTKSIGIHRSNERFVYRRDLSLPREDRKIAKNMAEQLQLMEQHIARLPEVDFQRRNDIRMAIVTGEYVIDSVSIADKFLQFETALYGKKR
jgi:anti-sigma28 factor (negative regulator of flagellin synthesis)